MTLPKGPEKTGLAAGYERRDFTKGPMTYSDPRFVDKIASVLGIETLPQEAMVLDLMSGPGKLSGALETKRPDLNFIALDWTHNQLLKAPTPLKVEADAKVLPLKPSSVDAIVARYAIKDLRIQDQVIAIQQAVEILRPGGRFVLVDMIAPNPKVKDWLNRQHALKQELSGRNPLVEGVCNIEDPEGWKKLLRQAGLTITVVRRHTSFVKTTDWKDGKQIGEEQLKILNTNILQAPSEAQKAFYIREKSGLVRINYPLIIMGAVKP